MNAPPWQVIFMAMRTRWSHLYSIDQCSMSMATPEATRRCHRAITCFVLPRRPLGRQANKTTMTNVPTLLAVLMAVTVRWYNNMCIAQWRRFMAVLKTTKCHHQTSTRFNSINQTLQHWLFLIIHREKGHNHKVKGMV